jgi:dynamin 1-like protein
MVENLVAIELAYVNTRHPDFEEARLIYRGLTDDGIEDLRRVSAHNAMVSSSGTHKQKTSPASIADSVASDMNSWWPKPGKGDGDAASSHLQPQHGNPTSQALSVAGSQPGSAPPSLPQSPSSRRGVNLLDEVPSIPSSRKLTSQEQRDCNVIERLIRSYFLIVRKNIQDSVPKAIMHFLVNYVKDNLQSELVSHLYKQEEIEKLLEESEHIAARRREASEMLKALQRASHIISEIRETHLW